MNNYKIAIVCDIIPPGYSGAGMAAYKHAEYLYQQKLLSFILTRTPQILNKFSPKIFGNIALKIDEEKIIRMNAKNDFLIKYKYGFIKRIIPFLIDNIKLYYKTSRSLKNRKEEYEIIHCYSTTWLTVFAMLIGKHYKKKIILEMSLLGHDDPLSHSKNDKIKLKYFIKKWQFRTADLIISKSEALRSAYLKAGFSKEKLADIPYFVDEKNFTKPNDLKVSLLKNKLLSEQYFPIILFVGAVSKRKGVDILINSFQLVKKKYNNAVLLIIGNNSTKSDDEEFYQKIKKIKKESESIKFINPIQNVNEYMFISDVFVFPSRREGFGIVIIEAMASELPVIVNHIEGITNTIVKNEESGYLIQSENPEDYNDKIQKILEDNVLRKKFINKAKNDIIKKYSYQNIMQKYISLYDKL